MFCGVAGWLQALREKRFGVLLRFKDINGYRVWGLGRSIKMFQLFSGCVNAFMVLIKAFERLYKGFARPAIVPH